MPLTVFLRKLLAGKKSVFRTRILSSAHRLSILAYRFDIKVINFTVNRSNSISMTSLIDADIDLPLRTSLYYFILAVHMELPSLIDKHRALVS